MKVQMANYSLACPTCCRVGAQLSFMCQNIASSLANRWWMQRDVGDMELASYFDQRFPA